MEVPGPYCMLKEATNSKRVPKLTIKVREHCLTQLNKALAENSRVCTLSPAVSLGKLEAAAVGLEYSVFLGVKSVQMYKLTVHKKTTEIGQCTRESRLHSSLVKDTSVSDGVLGFVKASQLVDSHPEIVPRKVGGSSLSNKPPTSFVAASKLVSDSRAVTQSDPVVLDDNDDDASGPSGAPQSKRGSERESPPSGATEVTSKDSHSCKPESTGVGRLKRVNVDPNDLFEDDPTSSEDETSPVPRVSGPQMFGFQMASSLCVASPAPSQSSTVSSDMKTRVTSSSLTSSVAVEIGGRGKGATGHTKPLPKIASFFEKSAEPSTAAGNPSEPVEAVGTEFSTGVDYQTDHDTYRVEQVVPCKNGLIALEEEALPVISSRKKAIADVVVKVLSTYYKKRRISSKDLFKQFAKRVSVHFLDQKISNSSGEEFTTRPPFWTTLTGKLYCS
jgi:ATP-dependent DNA helicase Q5